MDANKPVRRYIPGKFDPAKPKPAVQIDRSNVLVMAPVDGMLESALSILNAELIRFQAKSREGKRLDLSEARVLTGYIKALVELSKESREREKQQDLGELSTAELIKHLAGSLPPTELEAIKAELAKLGANVQP